MSAVNNILDHQTLEYCFRMLEFEPKVDCCAGIIYLPARITVQNAWAWTN